MSQDIYFPSLTHRENIDVNTRFRALADRALGKREKPHRVLSRQSAAIVGQPSGLQVVPTVGRIVVRWSPVAGAHRYEIQVSETNQFSNVQTFYRGDPELDFDGSPSTRYYVRVRSLARGRSPSPFSAILDTLTGLATTSHLDFQAATAPYESKISVFSPASVGNSAISGVLPPFAWDFPDVFTALGGVQLFFVTLTAEVFNLPVGSGARSTVRLLVDGDALLSTSQDLEAQLGMTSGGSPPVFTYVLMTLASIGESASLEPGDHRMSIEVDGSTGALTLLEVVPSLARLEIVELLR